MMKKSAAIAILLGSGILTTLLFTNAVKDDDSCSKDELCERMSAIVDRHLKSGEGLSYAHALEHMATRLGYGLNPVEPIYQPAHMDRAKMRGALFHLSKSLQGRGIADSEALVQALTADESFQMQNTIDLFRQRSEGRAKALELQKKLDEDVKKGIVKVRNGDFCLANPTDAYCARVQEIRKMKSWALQFSGAKMARGIRNVKFTRAAFGSQLVDSNGRVRDLQHNFDEVVLEFWMNHFNIDAVKSYYHAAGLQGYEATIRRNMYRPFGALLTEVINHPAMIIYLDNQQNNYLRDARTSSNQNLGRELLELHTIGMAPRTKENPKSPYDQSDVEQASAILTGTQVRAVQTGPASYEYGTRFFPARHIPAQIKGQKIPDPVVMGKVYPHSLTKQAVAPAVFTGREGNGQLMALLKDLAVHPRTALNLCRKLVSTFIKDGNLRKTSLADCRETYAKTGGDLRAVYAGLIGSPEFWHKSNFRRSFKNPLEMTVSQVRASGVSLKDLKGRIRELSFGNYMTAKMHSATTLLGLVLREYAFPTGYVAEGSRWLSKGYLAQSVASSFSLTNIHDGFTEQTPSPLMTDATEAAYSRLSTPIDRANFVFGKLWRYENGTRAAISERRTVASIVANPAKVDLYKVSKKQQPAQLRTALELHGASRSTIRK